MDNISSYMKRILGLRKVLRFIRVIALFIVFAFALSESESDFPSYRENTIKSTHEEIIIHSHTNIKINEVDKRLAQKARSISLIGILTAILVILITIPIELIFVRCPKCNSYIWSQRYTPHFCERCGQKFNK